LLKSKKNSFQTSSPLNQELTHNVIAKLFFRKSQKM
jgi:hypothetical protein